MKMIVYRLTLGDSKEYKFEIDVDRPDPSLSSDDSDYPFWTELSYHQCEICPLKTSEHKFCPAAVDIQHIAEQFSDILSIDRVDVCVETEERTYVKNCDVQEALRSLYGLIMASSSCPVLSRLKPLARSHLPFATLDETVSRIVGAYLIKERFHHLNSNREPDWELKGILSLYGDLEVVNNQLMNRLRNASNQDANYNAICTFVSFSMIVNMGIDGMLETTNNLLKQGF